MRQYVGQIILLTQKDLKETLRRPGGLLAAVVFSLLLLFIFSLQLAADPTGTNQWAPGLLWVIFLFASFFTMNQSFAKEQENDCHLALLLAVEEKSVLFFAKAIGNLLLLIIVAAVILPLAVVFWDLRGPIDIAVFAFILFFGLLGLSLVATLFSGITWQADAQQVLLPVLAVPLSIPLLLSLVELTGSAMGSGAPLQPWLYLLIIFDLLFFILPVLLFDYILEV